MINIIATSHAGRIITHLQKVYPEAQTASEICASLTRMSTNDVAREIRRQIPEGIIETIYPEKRGIPAKYRCMPDVVNERLPLRKVTKDD